MSEQNMQQNQAYAEMVEQIAPEKPLAKNCLKAFIAGGGICAFAQIIQILLINYGGFTKETVGNPTAVILIFIAAVVTCLGWYDKFAQWAGAGSAVPITGFGNGMVSAAIEYRSEGYVLGVGGNMFKIAGPVIVFGSTAAFIVAIIRYLVVSFL